MANKLTPKGVWKLLQKSFTGFSNDRIVKLSAALSYYTVFSIGPLIIVIIYLEGIFYGRDAIQGTVFDHLAGLVGADAAAQIQDMIKSSALTKGGFAAIIGVVTLL